MLNYGKIVRFTSWKTEIRRQLLLAEDHYAPTGHQLAYVSSRCEGKALRHIDPECKMTTRTPTSPSRACLTKVGAS